MVSGLVKYRRRRRSHAHSDGNNASGPPCHNLPLGTFLAMNSPSLNPHTSTSPSTESESIISSLHLITGIKIQWHRQISCPSIDMSSSSPFPAVRYCLSLSCNRFVLDPRRIFLAATAGSDANQCGVRLSRETISFMPVDHTRMKCVGILAHLFRGGQMQT